MKKIKLQIGDAVMMKVNYCNSNKGAGDILEVTDYSIDTFGSVYLHLRGYCSKCDTVHTISDDYITRTDFVEVLEPAENLK